MTTLTAGLLPWMPLAERVTFGGFVFDTVSRVRSHLADEVSTSLSAVASTFVEPFGATDPVLIWSSAEGQHPTFSEPDVHRAQNAARLLAVVSLVSNDYFTWSQPATATNFELIFQRFIPGNDSFAVMSRRREGQTLSGGHTFSATRFTRPTSAPSSVKVNLPSALLAAVEPAVDGDEVLSVRIRQSALSYAFANRLGEFTTIEAELFWAATAIEQLLAVSERPRNQGVTAAFAERLTRQVACVRPSWPRETMTSTWTRELYGQRSDVHGAPHQHRRWAPAWHVFLATVAYGLVLKNLLSAENRYVLTESDEVDLEAFSRRIARFRDRRLENGAAAWEFTHDVASGRRLRDRIAGYLQQEDRSDESPP